MPSITFSWPALPGLSLVTITCHPTPLASSNMFPTHRTTHFFFFGGQGMGQKETLKQVSMLRLSLTTPRSWLEAKSRVGYWTSWATQLPRELLRPLSHSFTPKSPGWTLSWDPFPTTLRRGSFLGASLGWLQCLLDSAFVLFNIAQPFLA